MQKWRSDKSYHAAPSPVLEPIRSAVGGAQMLMSQKVQQFFRLCQQSLVSVWQRANSWQKTPETRCKILWTGAEGCSGPAPNHTATSWPLWSLCGQDPSAYPQPTSQDLANFWDLLQLNIEDVRIKFQDLQRVKESGWRLPPEKKVRGSGGQMALLSLQHHPRAKATTCRRAAQMVTPSEALEALKVQNSVGIWPELRDILNLYKCKCISGVFTYFSCSDWRKHSPAL